MHLYNLELGRILKRKFTVAASAVLAMTIILILTKEYMIAEEIRTDLGGAAGYKRFLDLSDIFFCHISVWLIAIFAGFYCEDKLYQMVTLLSTTTNGKQIVFFRRLQVICTITAASFLAVILLTFSSCYLLYGYSKSRTSVGDVILYARTAAPALAKHSVSFFLMRHFVKVFIAFAMLNAMIVCISVSSRKVQYSLAVLLGIYFLPALLENLFKHHVTSIGYLIITSQPILLMLSRCLTESWPIYRIQIFIAPFISVCLVWHGMKRWTAVTK